jgi:hypothetical protein
MERFSEYNNIVGVSLHYLNGNARLYAGQDLMRLNKDLTFDVAPLFAVVNLTCGASPVIIRDIQELFNYMRCKLLD